MPLELKSISLAHCIIVIMVLTFLIALLASMVLATRCLFLVWSLMFWAFAIASSLPQFQNVC
jgi:hypothetical protein